MLPYTTDMEQNHSQPELIPKDYFSSVSDDVLHELARHYDTCDVSCQHADCKDCLKDGAITEISKRKQENRQEEARLHCSTARHITAVFNDNSAEDIIKEHRQNPTDAYVFFCEVIKERLEQDINTNSRTPEKKQRSIAMAIIEEALADVSKIVANITRSDETYQTAYKKIEQSMQGIRLLASNSENELRRLLSSNTLIKYVEQAEYTDEQKNTQSGCPYRNSDAFRELVLLCAHTAIARKNEKRS